jgi:tyrosinase
MLARRDLLLATAALAAAPHILEKSAVAAAPIVRRDVMDMKDNDPFFSDYAKAIQKMHQLANDGRNWIAQAKIHADYCHHSELEFLHWHRHYIRFFEMVCAELSGNSQFALPYWNWSKNSGRLPAPFFDRPELNVEHWNDPGQYVGKAWGPIDTVGRRGLDKPHGLLDDPVRGGAFTIATINGIKQLPNIDLFRPALEGQPHNTAHVLTGATKVGKTGHIGSGLSPLDPIFWLHHCMVDRVWAEWQKSAGHATPDPMKDYSGQFCDADGKPAKANSTGAMDVAALGYTYDTLQSASTTDALKQLGTAQINSLKQALQPRAPQVLGSAVNASASQANIETAINVAVPTLPKVGTDFRALELAAGTVGGRRILAKLSDVIPPATNDLMVNVFVDCPYLSPTTAYSDPHYAGSFSFFGAMKGMKEMPGMGGMKSPTFLVDITEGVRQGQFQVDKVKVQLMPVSLTPETETSSSFQVGKVEVITV